MILINNTKFISFLAIILLFLSGCNGKFPGADARKFPADPKKELRKILGKEGVSSLMINFVNLEEVSLILQVPTVYGELH